MKIIPARQQDAPYIGKAVCYGIGEEICLDFAGPGGTVADVEKFFTALAAGTDSQYSYLNAIVAVDDSRAGEPVMGVCVGYDGAELHRLRQAFFDAMLAEKGRDMPGMADETSPDEFYLDTLAVMPEYRGHGVGGALLMALAERGSRLTGKPAALLVDYDNPKAEALYRRLGFRHKDDRPFAGVRMKHMVLETPAE